MSFRALFIAMICLAAPAAALAGPILLDGNVDGNDNYAVTFLDGNEGAISDGLDIKSLSFDLYGGWFYMGLATYDQFDPDGSDSSVFGETRFMLRLEDNGNVQTLDITTDFNAIKRVLVDDSEVALADYQADVQQGLEFRIREAIFGAPSFVFVGQLDDMGLDADDQISGGTVSDIPEPATMAMLGLGGIGVLIRRRRRA